MTCLSSLLKWNKAKFTLVHCLFCFQIDKCLQFVIHLLFSIFPVSINEFYECITNVNDIFYGLWMVQYYVFQKKKNRPDAGSRIQVSNQRFMLAEKIFKVSYLRTPIASQSLLNKTNTSSL
jgi:hypothetical protein